MKLLYHLAAVLALTVFGFSQATVVTGTIVDANGSKYVNASVTANFINPSNKVALWNGFPMQATTWSTNADSNAFFTLTLPDLNFIAPATGTFYQFTICANTTPGSTLPSPTGQPGLPCFTYTSPACPTVGCITGVSLDISAAILAVPPPPLPAPGAGGNLSSQGTFTPGHDVQIFDQTHLQDIGLPTGTGIGVRQTGPALLGTVTIANLRLPNITGLTQCLHVDTTGLVSGTSLDCGSGGGGGVAGLNKQLQFNDAGSAAGTGTTATNPASQVLYSKATGQLDIPNLSNIRYVVNTTYNWSQSPAADLTGTGPKTITLTPCPLGIDVSNNVNAPFFVRVGTTGTPEDDLVTGGSCTSGASSGTITITTVNTHANGYTVSSDTNGIQEAINDFGTPNATVIVPPCTGVSTCYNIFSTVFLKSNKMTLSAYGANFSCQTRGPCFFLGDRAGTTQYHKFFGGRLSAGVNVDGIQITNTVATAGAYTATTNGNHPYVTGDYVWVDWYQLNAQQHAIVLITGTTSNTFSYSLGSATVGSAAAVGWSALEAAGIEDNGDGDVMRDVGFTSVGSPSKFHFGIVVDNDQAAVIDHINNEGSGAVFRCTANFCGSMVLGRSDNGAASVVWLRNSELSLQCGGNGVTDYSGNSLHVSDTVIQGFAQYGILYGGGLQAAQLTNVYEEVGSCANPLYTGLTGQPTPAIAASGFVLQGSKATISGTAPIIGQFPLFTNTGATRRNYYIVPKSASIGAGPMLMAGYALTNGSGTINVYWPQIPVDTTTGAITYDVLLTDGTQAPYPGNANSLATGISGSCVNSICTFADTQAATSAYTVTTQQWKPGLRWWPGSIMIPGGGAVVGGSFTTTSLSGLVSGNGVQTPSMWLSECDALPASTWTPIWISCPNGPLTGNGLTALNLQQKDFSGGSPPANEKGRVNFGGFITPPNHLVTLIDSNPAKAMATNGGRSANDPSDSFIGIDTGSQANNAGIAFGAPSSISQYLNNNGDGSGWVTRLTSSNFTILKKTIVNDGVGATTGTGTFGACAFPSGTADTNHSQICFDALGDLAFNKKNEAIWEKVIPQDYTFSSGTGFPALPAANTVATTQLAIIVDASTTACPVTSGGGSNRMLVRSNGTTWDCVGGSGGGSSISVSLFSGLPGSPSNNQLAVVTDWTGTCPVISGSGSTLHERLVIWNSGTSKWDCVPDGLLPLVTTTQAWDGAGNGGLHLSLASTNTNTNDQLDLHANTLGSLVQFEDNSGPPGVSYTLGMWPANASIPGLGLTKCLSVDSNGHIAFSSASCFVNVMTNPYDIIIGGTLGAPVRLALGANGTALFSNGSTLSYQAVLSNPMSAPNDMIIGGTAGAATRLANPGAVVRFLQTDGSGNVNWGSAPAGSGTVNSGIACNPAYYQTSTAAVFNFPQICYGDGSTTVWMKLNPTTASQNIFEVDLNSTLALSVDASRIVHFTSAGVQMANSGIYNGSGSGSSVDYSASADSNGNQTGVATFRNGDVVGNSSSSAGNTVGRGGNVTGTGATAAAGDYTVQPGGLINAAPGASATEGKLHVLNAYKKGATTTTGNLAVISADNTASDSSSTANNARAVGIIQSTNGGTVYVQVKGEITVNLDGSTTFSAGDLGCASSTGIAQVKMNGTAQCPNAFKRIGQAVAGGTSVSTAVLDLSFGAGSSDALTVLSGDVTTSGAVATIAANAVTAAKSAVVLTRRVCDMAFGDTSGAVLTNAQLGPQKRICFIPFAATVVEVDVAADGGTPNIIVGRSRAGVTSNLLSSALATASSGGIACSNTGGTTGLDAATTCSATLQNTGTNIGDYFEAVSGTAGGTAKFMTVHIVYTVN